MLPHVVCGRRVLDRREEEGETLQTTVCVRHVLICSTLDRDLMDGEPNCTATKIIQDLMRINVHPQH